MIEVREVVDLWRECPEGDPGPGALNSEHAVVVGDVLDLDVVPDRQVAQIPEVRPRGGQEELIVGVAEEHAILQHEAALVAPHAVLRVPRPALSDVPGENPGQEMFGVATADPVLEQRRRVEYADSVTN